MEKPTVSSIWSPQFLARHNVTERRFVSAFIKTGPTEGWLRNSFITRRVDGSEVTEYTWSTMPENRLTKKVRSPLKPVEQEYQRCRSHWKDSNGWKNSGWIQELKKSFTTALLETSTSISQVICMGVGSFTSHFDPAYSEVRTEASYHQLCALELMMDILSLHQKTVFNTKKVYMQDPNFDDVDEEFLSSKGFSVIRGLDANNMMTSSTFLYAPYLPWKETFKAFMVDCPALHMGNKLDEIIGRLLSYDWELCRASLERIEFVRAQVILHNWSTVELPHSIYTDEEEHVALCEALNWKPRPGKATSNNPCSNFRWVVGGKDYVSEVEMEDVEE